VCWLQLSTTALAAGGVPRPTSSPQSVTAHRTSAEGLQPAREIVALQQQLDVATESLRNNQYNAQNYFDVVLIIIGTATLVIALVAIGSTILGYRVVKRYIQLEFTRRADAAFDEHGRPILEAAVATLEASVTSKLADVDTALAEQVAAFHAATETAPS
jgi:hypothetical protein